MIEERNDEGSRLVQDASSSNHISTPPDQHVESSGSSSPLRSKANQSSDMAGTHEPHVAPKCSKLWSFFISSWTLTFIEREDDTRSWGNFLIYFSHNAMPI
jgi:hypothetical protein